jgi:hypothetical protein
MLAALSIHGDLARKLLSYHGSKAILRIDMAYHHKQTIANECRIPLGFFKAGFKIGRLLIPIRAPIYRFNSNWIYRTPVSSCVFGEGWCLLKNYNVTTLAP